MKKIIKYTLLVLVAMNSTKTIGQTTNNKKSFYDFKMIAIDGKSIDFSVYKGKKILIVNVASKCGYTPQYKELEELYKKYKDKLVILGFPANNFAFQEPGNNKEIADFCEKNYGVTFQLFEKISVKGKDQDALYHWLSHKSENGWNDDAPSWNFCKYLINEKGELVKFYKSSVNPLSDEIVKEIEK
jgi:glutathione peroxidase